MMITTEVHTKEVVLDLPTYRAPPFIKKPWKEGTVAMMKAKTTDLIRASVIWKALKCNWRPVMKSPHVAYWPNTAAIQPPVIPTKMETATAKGNKRVAMIFGSTR